MIAQVFYNRKRSFLLRRCAALPARPCSPAL